MTTCFLAPDPIQGTFLIPGGNTPGNGVQLFLYAAGSSTKQTVYKDSAAATPWSNPIVLDSGGNLPNGSEVWFPTGQTFKAVWAPSNDTDPPASPYRTMDNLAGMNDVSVTAQSEWVSGPTPTFVSSTQFTLSGDQTSTFTKARRVKTTNTGGTVYGVITSVTFAANTTTVNIVSDSGNLDSGLSAVFYGILDPANPSTSPADVNRRSANVASSGTGTTDIWGVIGDYVHVTGTNTINFFSTAPYSGAMRDIVFDGALSLNFANPSMLINGGANVTTAANDRAKVRADTVSTFTIELVRNSGFAVSSFVISTMTNSLNGDVNLSTQSVFFAGPTVAQGTTGTWWASGTITALDTAGIAQIIAKLYDGTTVIDMAVGSTPTANFPVAVAVSGFITNPAGNIRIDVADGSASTGVLKFQQSGTKNSTISVMRIA